MYEEPAPAWLSVLTLALLTGTLAVRRRWPSVVLVVQAVVFVAHVHLEVPESLFANIALFSALYTVGAWEPRRTLAFRVRVFVIAGMLIWLVAAIFMTTSDPDSLPELSRAGAFSPLVAYLMIQLLTNILYFAGAYWFGDRQWASARERARTELRTQQLEQERRRVASQAVAIERLRLARELHDAVAHHVSMMGVQAAVARTLLDTDPAQARDTLEHVEESAREAIDELHGILGTLRDEPDAETTDPVGSLGVDRIPELVATVGETGLAATFVEVGEPVRLSPVLSLNLYRIAQEALTNTRKHAGPHARAEVRLRYLGDAVELEVTDDGAGRKPAAGPQAGPLADGTPSLPGAGLGLVGIQERVAADGGTLEARPRSRGGFLVRARVPLDRRDGDRRDADRRDADRRDADGQAVDSREAAR
jgi:signal transduction histidine kinase